MGASEPYHFALIDPHLTISGEGLIEIIDSWDGVERWWRRHRSKKEVLIGYISYEQGYRFMGAPRDSVLWKKKGDRLRLPPVLFGRFRRRVQHRTERPYFSTQNVGSLKQQYRISQSTYRRMFRAAHEHIRIGDIYQVNLAHRMEFDAPLPPKILFWKLFQQQPVPYGALITTPEFAILSLSPELFLHIHDGIVETQPMKGTRPRGATVTRDQKFRAELYRSEKERAELDMIIDVHRNDLHRIAKTGSVHVVRRRELVGYETVWQAQARINGRLRRGISPLDVIASCFPAGSITGAPKLRAMEIIHELEPTPRHVYSGAIGIISGDGNMKFNVAIRTAILAHAKLYYSVGGGIVFDSTAAAEWKETLTKASLFLKE